MDSTELLDMKGLLFIQIPYHIVLIHRHSDHDVSFDYVDAVRSCSNSYSG